MLGGRETHHVRYIQPGHFLQVSSDPLTTTSATSSTQSAVSPASGLTELTTACHAAYQYDRSMLLRKCLTAAHLMDSHRSDMWARLDRSICSSSLLLYIYFGWSLTKTHSCHLGSLSRSLKAPYTTTKNLVSTAGRHMGAPASWGVRLRSRACGCPCSARARVGEPTKP